MLGIIAVIFIMDINPLRKQIKHEEVVQAGKITTETTEVPSEVTGKMEDVRDVVRFLSNTLKSLGKEHVIQSIPELPELGKQFEKTINSWGTRTDSVDSSQLRGMGESHKIYKQLEDANKACNDEMKDICKKLVE